MIDLDRPASPDDPQAGLRAELLGQLVAAQFDLEAVLTELARSGNPTEATQSQLQRLTTLQHSIGAASPEALNQMRAEIVATVNGAQAIAQQGRASSSTDDRAADPAQQSRRSLTAIQRDLFESRVLDPYLQFASADDEEEYRQRERERNEAMQRELAKGTLEGQRRANEIAAAQMADARAHGADASPDFGRLQSQIEQNSLAIRQQEQAQSPVPASADNIGLALAAAGVSLAAETESNAIAPDRRPRTPEIAQLS